MRKRISSILHALYQTQLKFSRISFYALIVLFFLYGTFSCFTYALKRQQSSNTDVNTLCNPKEYSKDIPTFCDIPSDLKFSKFLVFVTDGWPIKYAQDLVEHYKDNSILYLVDIPGAKYSHAIYTSYLTGQLPTNYKGEAIAGDHLIRSLLRSPIDYRFRYIGPEWSFLAIFGKENYPTFFDKVTIFKEALDINYVHPYPFFFENGRSGLLDYLNDLAATGSSMFAHSGVFDHRQHGEHRGLGPSGKSFPRTDQMARVMNSDMKHVKSWVDQHPEYLLIFLSDHGVDEYDMAGYRMHGQTENGNEPFILLYNPKIEHPKHDLRIDVVDVAATLTFYLDGADIPANSMGVAQPYFGPNASQWDERVLRQNVAQLQRMARDRGLPVRSSDSQDPTTLRSVADQLKRDLYSAIYIPWLRIFFFTAIAACAILVIFIQHNEGLESYVLVDDYIRFVRELTRILAMYGGSFLMLLVCWWGWTATHENGTVWRLFSPFLALRALQALRLSSSGENILSTGERKLYANEAINLISLFLLSSFPDLVETLTSLPGTSTLVTVAMMFVTWKIQEPRSVQERSVQESSTLRVERILVTFSFGLVWLYEWTGDEPEWFVAHFHMWALAAFLVVLTLSIFYLTTLRFQSLVHPLNLLLFLLHKDSTLGRCFLILLNVQLAFCLVPVIHTFQSLVAHWSNKRESVRTQVASEGHQATFIYLMNQVFFTFMFGFGEKVNLDVHPFSGRIGLDSYDVYPLVSAGLMTLHKYGIFALLVVYGWTASHQKATFTPTWLRDLLTVILSLAFTMSNLGLYLMFWVATRFHPIEGAVATTLLLGTMGIAFSALQLFHAYKTRNAISRTFVHQT